jgi:O-antigen ligase
MTPSAQSPRPRVSAVKRLSASRRSPLSVPFLFALVFLLMLVTNFRNYRVFGFNTTGWAWVIIALASLFRIARCSDRVAFPVWLWAPWSLYVCARAFSGYEYAWQSTCQILCPVVAGIAASTYDFSELRAAVVGRWLRKTYYAMLAGIAVIVIPFSLRHIDNSGWANGAISLLLFQSWFLAAYVLNGRKTLDLVLYLSAVAVPIIGANRGPMVAGVALAVCAVLPIRFRGRLLIAACALVLGLIAFFTPKVQYKMFYSGHGALQDLRTDNPNLQMNGRKSMWATLTSHIDEAPILGHGGNADRTYLLNAGNTTYLPHNDWLRIAFNYGFLGLALYAGTLAFQFVHCHRHIRFRGSPALTHMTAAALTCFIGYAVVMYTDNVLIYCQYFTVPMMILIGAAYSAARSAAPVRRPFRSAVRPFRAAPLPR